MVEVGGSNPPGPTKNSNKIKRLPEIKFKALARYDQSVTFWSEPE